MTTRLGLPVASRCVRQHKGEHVHEKVTGYVCKVDAPGLGQQTRGGDGTRPRVAKRALGGVPASTRTGMRVQECHGARSTGRKDTTEGDASACHSGTPASSARSRKLNSKRGVLSLPGEHVRVRGCTTVSRVLEFTGRARLRAHRRRGHDSRPRRRQCYGQRERTGGRLRKGERVQCCRQRHLQEISQHGTKTGLTQRRARRRESVRFDHGA
jgi:hypothetical protein